MPVCPIEAIFPEDELPEAWAHYTEWNAYLVEYWATAEKSEEDILTWKDAS